MSGGDDESNSDGELMEGTTGYVFYRDRPEWKDIEPLPQDDGPNPVVKIAYTDNFQDVYDYLRAVMNKNEKSLRALHLTTDAIDCNPANYTVWHYRREILQELKMDLTEEFAFAEEIVLNEPKNYQIWYHRQKLVEWTNDPSKELKLTADMIREDSKNYHSWQHRQWVIRTYNLWDQELSFIEQLLNEDLRNNSAWNQRYFVISNTTGYSSDDVIKREIQFALSYIKMAPNNESAWNYLHGVLKGKDISSQQDVREMCDQLISQQICSPHLMSTMIDIYDEEASRGNNDSLVKAIELCAELSTKIDPIRERYWNYIAKKLKSKHGQIN